MEKHPVEEAQEVRFGLNEEAFQHAIKCAGDSEPYREVQWVILEKMGFTPEGVIAMIHNYWILVEGRRKIVETNTRLTEENRELRRRW